MKKSVKYFVIVFSLLVLISCTNNYEPGSVEHIKAVTGAVDDEMLETAQDHPEDWPANGQNFSEAHYSPLDQITQENVNELGLAWSVNLGIYRGIEATPVVVDGIMYLSGPWSMVYAIDARKGELIWVYDPLVPREHGVKVCCDVVNRGVSVYKGMVFVGTLDGRLVSIDAATGEKIWETYTIDNPKMSYSITGGTRVYDGKVFIGNSGAEYGVRGYVSAYDALTGELAWRLYTVPGDPSKEPESEAMEKALPTWTGEWWKMGGGGTVWDAIVYDPELKLVYIGTGNGSPWNIHVRSPEGGDNLYLSSIIALDVETGKMKWYYQQIPGETFDFTSTQPIILADLEIEGKQRKVLMQAPKNGFFYVLDRVSGELISAEPYVYVNWASHIDMETGRPVEHPLARFENWAYQKAPPAYGGHNWHPMAYNPNTGLVYIPARDGHTWVASPKEFNYDTTGWVWNTGMAEWRQDIERIEDPNLPKGQGKLIAWNPIKQEAAWTIKQPSVWNGGVLSLKNMIFQGDAKGFFKAFDAATGKELWSYDLKTGIMAAPCTYMVDGVQYISVAVGWGGAEGLFGHARTEKVNPGTVYTFALGENGDLPDFGNRPVNELIDIPFEATQEQLDRGAHAYWSNSCFICHGSGGALPELNFSSKEVYNMFDAIVGKGAFLAKGMPNFGDRISEEDIQNLKLYLLNDAKQKRNFVNSLSAFGITGDALPNGWEKIVPFKKSDDGDGIWEGRVELDDGNVRFLGNNDWNIAWGGGSFPNGLVFGGSGADFAVQKGTYDVKVNLMNRKYSFTLIE